jgi:murein DD-endopeptidase MepM/ murein hydrolase activator NlpD
MSGRVGLPGHNVVQRLVAASLLAGLTAACSSETLRFSETPFSNPFSSSQRYEPTTTGSIAPAPMPSPGVVSSPLPAVSSAPLAAPSAVAPVANATTRAVTASRTPLSPTGLAGAATGWTAQGGTPVTLGAGETVATLSNRYGVPTQAILAANGLTSVGQAVPGQQILIPVFNGARSAAAPAAAAPVTQAPRPVAATPAPARVAPPAQPTRAAPAPAAAAPVQRTARVATSPQPAAPAPAKPVVAAKPASPAPAAPAKAAEAKPAPRTAAASTSSAPAKPAPAAAVAAKPAEAKPAPVAAETKPAPAAETKTAAAANPAPEDNTSSIARSNAEFRWPARGRVIQGFSGRGGSEGINIALPEGTPIKAAEGGTVAYAGSELKGYGNLVLIRHDNGFVSAYAHNSELAVKRGERVTRGQTIAKSGQTGNVTTPQLHFELRKGSTPVDPMQHLSGL